MPKDFVLPSEHPSPNFSSPLRALGLAEIAVEGAAIQISAQHPTLAELPRPVPLKPRPAAKASKASLRATLPNINLSVTHVEHPEELAPLFDVVVPRLQAKVDADPVPYATTVNLNVTALEDSHTELQAIPASNDDDDDDDKTEYDAPFATTHDGALGREDSLPSAPKTPARSLELLATQSKRSTVLPRSAAHLDTGELHFGQEERYQRLAGLGQGGAGDVLLARDNDIQRMVAVKKLKKQLQETPAVMRFVEEIRTVGQLEHPNIVPIHDVGIDQDGQYYFVMKYVDGETMEQIIEKLRVGDPETTRRYPLGVRNQIFLKILEAIEFAHSKGWIHRDIKPANIMIGEHGEVMVMDWGLAKQIHGNEPLQFPPSQAPVQQAPHTLSQSIPSRMLETRQDTLLGTPAYMSPEQALGHNDAVDERSDIYSLSVLYYEWIGLNHYMQHKHTLQEMLYGIIHEEPKTMGNFTTEQNPVPPELSYFAKIGLQKDPTMRYESIAEMRDALQLALSGRFEIHCPVTFNKRAFNELLHFADRHPLPSVFLTIGLSLLVLLGGVQAFTLLAALF